MINKYIKIEMIILLISTLIIFNFNSYGNSLQNTTINEATKVSNRTNCFYPLIKELDFLEIYTQLLPMKKLINLYNYRIEEVNYHKNIYLISDEITTEVNLLNKNNKSKTLWLGYSLKDPLGNYLDFHGREVILNARSQNLVRLSIEKKYFSTNPVISGEYDAIFALWDKNPMLEDAQRVSHYEKENAIRIYSILETFDTLDSTQWFSRKGVLGRSSLTPENVFINDQFLNIKLSKNSYSGGEIRSLETVHYGSYEINMQLPEAPSSLTGFFLYKAPDYFHEIDIEIYNKKTTEILFTTYADGSVQNNTILPLDFDPTSTFNTYRIDYYPHEVSFYVNNQLIEKFTDNFSKEPMYLMVNTWYPKWLKGLQQKNDQHLKINWIRY